MSSGAAGCADGEVVGDANLPGVVERNGDETPVLADVRVWLDGSSETNTTVPRVSATSL